MFDRAALSANLLRLRSARGETQSSIALAAGLSRVGYRAIESGDAMPRTETLVRIADALKVTIQDLLRPVETLHAVRFRAKKRMVARDQLLLDVGRWLESYAEVEKSVGDFGKGTVLTLSEETLQLKPGPGRAQEAAREARSQLNLQHNDAIRDICGLLEDNGIKVFRPVLASDSFFGMAVGAEHGGPAVVVNTWERISVERWIFSAAHELGHILLHLASFDASESEEVEGEEAEADIFASHFLMPEELFKKEWDEAAGLGFVDAVLKLKRIFRVSWKTVVYRLASEPDAPPDLWARFYGGYKRQTGKSLKATEEPGGLNPDEFTVGPAPRPMEPEQLSPADFVEDRLARLVRKAVIENKISLLRAAEILGIDAKSMRARQQSWL